MSPGGRFILALVLFLVAASCAFWAGAAAKGYEVSVTRLRNREKKAFLGVYMVTGGLAVAAFLLGAMVLAWLWATT